MTDKDWQLGENARAAAGGSRLERWIDRLSTQRACLDHAAELVADVPGIVVELGLGKGRTFDHLRHIMPGREIFALDAFVHAPEDSVPDDAHLVLGDFRETLPRFCEEHAGHAALVHADIGSASPERDRQLVAAIAPWIAKLPARGAMVIADRELALTGAAAIPKPETAGGWPYFLYRVN